MKYQFSFERLNKVHWLFCDKRDTAQFIYDALKIAGNTNIEVLENPNMANRKWVHTEFEVR